MKRVIVNCIDNIFADNDSRRCPTILLINSNNAIGMEKNNSESILSPFFKVIYSDPPWATKIKKEISRLIFKSLFSGI